MSYSNIDRSVDQPTTFGRGGEGNITKHDELNRKDAGAPNPIAEKARQTLELGNIRNDHPMTDTTHSRDAPHSQMTDSRGLFDQRDGTHPGGITDRSAVTRPHEGLRGEAGLGGGQREHHTHQPAHLGHDPAQTSMGAHRGLYDESDRTHVSGAQRDIHRPRDVGNLPRHPERENDIDTGRRAFPAEDEARFSSIGRGGITEPRTGIRDDGNQYRTFPADDGVNINRPLGSTDHAGDFTQPRTGVRDDNAMHRTFPGAEDKDVMSTGSQAAGKVMDEGRNETGRQDVSDQHRTHLTGASIDPERATKAGHPHTGHHDPEPRLQRTDDRVLKGTEQHRLPGEGKEPYYGETDDTKHVAGQHGHPEQGHVSGTGATNTTGRPGHVGIGDKIIGAAVRMAGKIIDDPKMQQSGTARKQGEFSQTGTDQTGTGHPTTTDRY